MSPEQIEYLLYLLICAVLAGKFITIGILVGMKMQMRLLSATIIRFDKAITELQKMIFNSRQ